MTSSNYFDVVAIDYDTIASKRNSYLTAIEDLIIAKAYDHSPKSYIDVGCGIADRTMRIAELLHIQDVAGLDESKKMLAQATGVKTIHGSILTKQINMQFDLVTMLWNVLGHISSKNRVPALKNVSKLMKPGAVLYFDVNNQSNKKSYGKNQADVISSHKYSHGVAKTMSHRFKPNEVDELIEQISSLKIISKLFIDYETGKVTDDPHSGQIFYEIMMR